MRLIFHLLILPLLIFACALGVLWMPLPNFLSSPSSGSRNLVVAVLTGLLMLGNIIWLAFYLIRTSLGGGRVVDEVFAPFELQSKGYALFGRQYQGLVQGRQVEITFVPGRLRRMALSIYINAALNSRVAIGEKRPLLDCRECPPLTPDDPQLSRLKIYAGNERLGQALSIHSESRAVLERMFFDRLPRSHREIYIQPDRVWLYAHPMQIESTAFRQWVEDLLTLAGIAETLERGAR